jgi:hypothetical protein
MQQFTNWDDYIRRKATGLGINTKGLIKTKEELDAQAKQQQLQATTQTLGPNVIDAVAANRREQMKIDANASEQPPIQQ